MNILFIVNKYLEGKSLSLYFPYFLANLEKELEERGHKIYFVFFSQAMTPRLISKNNLVFSGDKKIKNLEKTARKLEIEYEFTFKQAYFSELIQVSKSQDLRQINLPEKEFNKAGHLVGRFLYLEKIIKQKKIDVVFCDQSAEAEMEFARSICHKKGKIFLRNIECFLGRSIFLQQFSFGEERVVLPLIDPSITRQYAEAYVDDFVMHNRLPYEQKTCLKPDVKEFYLSRIIRFYRYPQYIKIYLMKPYLWFEEKVLKALVRRPFDKKRDYFYFGFHLPSESTVALRALPFMSQVSLIESISRVLPEGHYLYVREHPLWKTHFSYGIIKNLKALPNVRLISTRLGIGEIIKHSKGVLTYNATTGIEALIYGKPVLAFAPNVYSGIHPAAAICKNMFQVGAKLSKLMNTQVNKNDTYQYIYKLMRSTSATSLAAGTFLSEDDSATRAKVFASSLIKAVNYCLKNADPRIKKDFI